MPTSDKQIEANRRNALRSTGPTTARGKRTVSQNALTHGILAREALIARDDLHEDAEEFESLLTRLHQECAPYGPLEELLVQQIATCYWRLRRIIRADSVEFGKTLAQSEKPPATVDYFGERVIQRSSLPSADKLETIVRYEKAIHGQLYRAMHHLERLQSRRTDQPLPPTLTVHLSDEL